MNPTDNLVLDYSSPIHDCPGFWKSVWGVISAVAAAVAGAFTQAITTGAKELAAMVSLDRIVGVGVNYAKQQASTAITSALMSAGNQSWVANFLHAAGLDFSDLLQVSKNALDVGFNILTSDLSSILTKTGLMSDASLAKLGGVLGVHGDAVARALGASSESSIMALSDHARLAAAATADWTMFSTRSFAGEEEKMRSQISAIFTDTPERIRARSELAAAHGYNASSNAAQASLEEQLPGILGTLGKTIRPIQDWLNDQLLSARNTIFTLLVPALPVSYDKVGAAAVSAYAAAFGMGMAAHGVAVAADLVHPLKATGFPQLAAFLADMAGFGVVARDTWYADVKNFLGEPYKYFSLRYFRPSLPGKGDLQDLYAKNLILEEDFDRAMQYHGYRDEWIRAWKNDIYTRPRIRDLALMLQDATIGTSEVYDILRRGGYSPTEGSILARQILKRSLSSYLSAYSSKVKKLLELGYISEQQFYSQLEPLGLSSEAQFLMMKTARFGFIEDYTNLSVSMFKTMHERDLIDDADLETSLAGLGIVAEKRDIIVAMAKVKRLSKVAAEEKAELKAGIRKQQTLLTDTYVLAYRSGLIDDAALEAALVYAGLSADLAVITVGLERQKKIHQESQKVISTKDSLARATRSKLQAGYIALFQKGLIDETALEVDLTALGLADDDVASIVAMEAAKKMKPEAVPLH